MAKAKTVFICQQCGMRSPKWLGKCPECENWNSFVETIESAKAILSHKNTVSKKPITLAKIEKKNKKRISTGVAEFDSALGGGVVEGQVILIAGEPGIGKSTLLLQVASNMNKVVYVAGEESASQIKIRADRLGMDGESIDVYEETDIDVVLASIAANEPHPDAVIVDSIQTVFVSELQSIPGSVGQVREASFRLIQYAKSNNIPLFIVGHVTKGGSVAGPSTLAHMVDTVCWFEGDKTLEVRIVRAIKNRFGPTNEVGIFAMRDKGLVSLDDSQVYFLQTDSAANTPGSVKTCVLEGTRPILVEAQALVVPTKLAIPRRVAQGIDSKRLEMILAVMIKHLGLNMNERDVYINIVGGITVRDPGIDLAVAMAVASSYRNKVLPKDLVAFGEVGLLGELRHVSFEEQRIKQTRKRGFKQIVSPQSHKGIKKLFTELL